MISRLKLLRINRRLYNTYVKTEFPNCSLCLKSDNSDNSDKCDGNNKPKNETDKKIEKLIFDIDKMKTKLIYNDVKILIIVITGIFSMWDKLYCG
jgi:hypothetical protein